MTVRPVHFRFLISEHRLEAARSIRSFHEGDGRLLAERVLRRAKLSDEEAKIFASLALGKKRPARRPRRGSVEVQNEQIATSVLVLQRLHPTRKKEAIIAQVMRAFRVSRRQVFYALKRAQSDPRIGPTLPQFADFVAGVVSGRYKKADASVVDVHIP